MRSWFDETDRDVLVVEASKDLNRDPPAQWVKDVEQKIAQGLKKLVVDCSKVDYLHTPALSCIVNLHMRMRKRDGHMAVCSLNERILKLFRIVRLDLVLDIQPDVRRACDALKRIDAASA